ncbi:nematoblast specific protein [Roseivirga ehrenbergii]|uniref:Nematoblast specific protein n=1 Tax=Roseivirga ehrenbergii (strain DSM 102268 / JCM 13514 / KCTC 12282 / NCIMB 14502 / KMM 6017) TaxID=279360 RepID=A0A150WXI0_ROSEK|nr:nematoblast specific protein [Roseivirga ehrenbergii]
MPTKGNTWVEGLDSQQDRTLIDNGVKDWNPNESAAKTYFYTESIGEIKIGMKAKAANTTTLNVSFNCERKTVKLSNTELELVSIATFNIENPGYHTLEITGDDNATPIDISEILIGGAATEGKVYFVKDDFYWGRRGPSVHLTYQVPEAASDVLYFYNEINVPEGEDVLGSYFMANGFAEGYFGIQVNGADERRILFSVWSPFKTDNPKEIPEDQQIKMLKNGDGVYTGEFGNEGSGGQSYRKYMWKTGTSYRFLLKAEPAENNNTDYTAYFFAPEIGEWELIASFRRPKTDTYVKRPHSFLENFHTETGNQTRKGLYSNQWVYDTKGNWHEMTTAKFTADATARKESRMDYTGGAEGTSFFMKNCGFFTGWTTIDSMIEREPLRVAPKIDFSLLP